MELDETPTPTRKMSKSSVPVSNKAEPSTHDRIKGRRVIKYNTDYFTTITGQSE
jgi:hypothetical protein